MDRDTGLRALGLTARAEPLDIERAYKDRCRPLKRRLLRAKNPFEVGTHRDALRDLVRVRDAALGRAPRRDWGGDRIGISGSMLVSAIQRLPVIGLDNRGARGFFRLPTDASEEDVMEAYGLRVRALVRRFANARDEDEMATIRRARSKLRTIRNFALASR